MRERISTNIRDFIDWEQRVDLAKKRVKLLPTHPMVSRVRGFGEQVIANWWDSNSPIKALERFKNRDYAWISGFTLGIVESVGVIVGLPYLASNNPDLYNFYHNLPILPFFVFAPSYIRTLRNIGLSQGAYLASRGVHNIQRIHIERYYKGLDKPQKLADLANNRSNMDILIKKSLRSFSTGSLYGSLVSGIVSSGLAVLDTRVEPTTSYAYSHVPDHYHDNPAETSVPVPTRIQVAIPPEPQVVPGPRVGVPIPQEPQVTAPHPEPTVPKPINPSPPINNPLPNPIRVQPEPLPAPLPVPEVHPVIPQPIEIPQPHSSNVIDFSSKFTKFIEINQSNNIDYQNHVVAPGGTAGHMVLDMDAPVSWDGTDWQQFALMAKLNTGQFFDLQTGTKLTPEHLDELIKRLQNGDSSAYRELLRYMGGVRAGARLRLLSSIGWKQFTSFSPAA